MLSSKTHTAPRKVLTETGERTSPEGNSVVEKYLFQRQFAVYRFCEPFVADQSVVLDLACGDGYGTAHLSHYCGRVIGGDVDLKTIDLARQKYLRENLSFVPADGVDLPFDSSVFDVVVSSHTIEHIADDERFVCELRRVLRPSGCCIFSTPNRVLRLRENQRPWNPFHVREYSAETLDSRLKTAFKLVDLYGLHATPVWKDYELRRLRNAAVVARWDPWGLRHKLPIITIRLLQQLCSRFNRGPVHSSSVPEFAGVSPDDFTVTPVVKDSLDLIAVCRP